MNFANLKDVDAENAPGAASSEAQGGNEAEELKEALSEEETEFIAAEKKPINQSALMLFAIMLVGGAGMYLMHLKAGPKAVQTLQLQTVVIRANRKACMINNTMYQEGESVESFTIEKISPSAVIVRSGVYRFELKMAK